MEVMATWKSSIRMGRILLACTLVTLAPSSLQDGFNFLKAIHCQFQYNWCQPVMALSTAQRDTCMGQRKVAGSDSNKTVSVWLCTASEASIIIPSIVGVNHSRGQKRIKSALQSRQTSPDRLHGSFPAECSQIAATVSFRNLQFRKQWKR